MGEQDCGMETLIDYELWIMSYECFCFTDLKLGNQNTLKSFKITHNP
jgi:hypothetical protein